MGVGGRRGGWERNVWSTYQDCRTVIPAERIEWGDLQMSTAGINSRGVKRELFLAFPDLKAFAGQ